MSQPARGSQAGGRESVPWSGLSPKGPNVSKHFLDETAEFKMPAIGRHAAEDDELEPTQRFDPGFGNKRQRPSVPASQNPQA